MLNTGLNKLLKEKKKLSAVLGSLVNIHFFIGCVFTSPTIDVLHLKSWAFRQTRVCALLICGKKKMLLAVVIKDKD